MMRRTLLWLIVVAILAGGCETKTMAKLTGHDDFIICTLAGVETDVEHHDQIAGLGAVGVRRGNCQGEVLMADMNLHVELWTRVGGLGFDCDQTANLHTAQPSSFLAATVKVSETTLPICELASTNVFWTRVDGASAWIEGELIHADVLDS